MIDKLFYTFIVLSVVLPISLRFISSGRREPLFVELVITGAWLLSVVGAVVLLLVKIWIAG